MAEGVADLNEEKLSDPHIRYFAEVNPGHKKGDELICITRLSESNLQPIIKMDFLGLSEDGKDPELHK